MPLVASSPRRRRAGPLVGRWDLRVVDEDAFIEAGRAAYLKAWLDSVQDDAVIRVQ